MNLLQIGGLLLGGGLLAKLLLGKKEPSDGGVPADAGAVVPVDANGTAVPSSSTPVPSGVKPKIPAPKMPVGWKSVPYFLTKNGVYYYNPAYVDYLRSILAAYAFTLTNQGGTSVKLTGLWGGVGQTALDWARKQQKAGLALVAPVTLFKGQDGQMGASIIGAPKANIDSAHINSTLAVLPNL